jgi:hypothetical protein
MQNNNEEYEIEKNFGAEDVIASIILLGFLLGSAMFAVYMFAKYAF